LNASLAAISYSVLILCFSIIFSIPVPTALNHGFALEPTTVYFSSCFYAAIFSALGSLFGRG
jgi:hypothetical protein